MVKMYLLMSSSTHEYDKLEFHVCFVRFVGKIIIYSLACWFVIALFASICTWSVHFANCVFCTHSPWYIAISCLRPLRFLNYESIKVISMNVWIGFYRIGFVSIHCIFKCCVSAWCMRVVSMAWFYVPAIYWPKNWHDGSTLFLLPR